MSCERITNGFICQSSYIQQEINWWANNPEEYKKEFIIFLMEKTELSKEEAKATLNIFLDTNETETPHSDVDLCIEQYVFIKGNKLRNRKTNKIVEFESYYVSGMIKYKNESQSGIIGWIKRFENYYDCN